MKTSKSEIPSTLLALSNDLAGAVERAGRAVVAVNARHRLPSSGLHWRSGVIVTADHTVKRDEEITVTLPDGSAVPAALAGRDPSTDLAVLKLKNAKLPTAEIDDASLLKVGHLVLALGRPGERGLSATMGTVSALSGAWHTWSGGLIDQFVHVDIALYPGFSGGPLVDAQGLVVGVNTAGPRGMVLVIPASTVDRVVDQLLKKGRIARGYLGLGMQPVHLPEGLKSALSLTADEGVIVVNVVPYGPAEKAGALIGDVLVAMDGKSLRDMDDVQAFLDPEHVGKTVSVNVVRGGALVRLAITVGERPRREE
ncbi:trypsin-like peptidase domain-containing protein [Candidatus Acetothermia bacterium]|nr:trypsin-like peptidase domain-containing protein [Candidatus Acetothermia bacterium]MBI3460149.1 trypsin-like peptidase domain-containing protein [Candidatus Acetothermia bacterium]MBI3659962.1 trypsin-like peptidase domain-containing protein [Candidatus Acetothermia bacterium]